MTVQHFDTIVEYVDFVSTPQLPPFTDRELHRLPSSGEPGICVEIPVYSWRLFNLSLLLILNDKGIASFFYIYSKVMKLC